MAVAVDFADVVVHHEVGHAAAEQPDSSGSARANEQVALVVDDDPDMRQYVARSLRHMTVRFGQILEAGNAADALTLVRSRPVGLIISDVVMPNMDGYALTRAVRALDCTPQPAIVLITGEASARESTPRALEAGAQRLVCKPFNAHSLCQAVEEALKGFEI